MRRKIDRRNEDLLRADIIDVSRQRDAAYIPLLLELLWDTRTPQQNRRHIVRALGQMGDQSVAPALLAILRSDEGLIVGDAAHALGALGSADAIPRLQELSDSEEDWVAQKARWALKRLRKRSG